MQTDAGSGCLDDGYKADAGKWPRGARPDEAVFVQGLYELAQEERVAMMLDAGDSARGEVVESLVEGGEGLVDESLSLGIDMF